MLWEWEVFRGIVPELPIMTLVVTKTALKWLSIPNSNLFFPQYVRDMFEEKQVSSEECGNLPSSLGCTGGH